jgi:hypothetical protein
VNGVPRVQRGPRLPRSNSEAAPYRASSAADVTATGGDPC